MPKLSLTDPQRQRLTPRKYQYPGQINESLGNKRAARMAQLLGIKSDFVLTERKLGDAGLASIGATQQECGNTATMRLYGADAGAAFAAIAQC